MQVSDLLSIVAFVVIAVLLLKERKAYYVYVAALAYFVAALWVGTYGYEYEDANRILLGVNLYAASLWALAFFLTAWLHEKLFRKRWVVTLLIWIITIVAAEWAGYHLLNIRLASDIPGIPIIDILHIELYAKIFYLIAVPVFAFLVEWLYCIHKERLD